MSDRLEDFMREHSAEFDLHEPDMALWNKIEKDIAPKKSISWRYYISRAAVVIFIFGASFLVQQLWFKKGSGIIKPKQEAVNLIIPELQEAEIYYSGLISEKLEEVKPLLTENPSLEKELRSDLGELDSIYAGLKNDLKDNIANDEVIEAMIQNYRLRISILEDMLTYLKSDDQNDSINNTEYEL
jgi:hypothetical protein